MPRIRVGVTERDCLGENACNQGPFIVMPLNLRGDPLTNTPKSSTDLLWRIALWNTNQNDASLLISQQEVVSDVKQM